ncbi:hut operon transcriptional regulator HutP [Phocicoccus pinnipedialis]|uniref:Hut operon positive regulatory protein n=1 Tax=Phocicoccus pinnipedialis TaxID=110845 RepID=A0A6V7R4N5_9BACL|nr:hut operon transcriptional regulator HutP [Jeotgalicoccus pinnipedialis]MBP1939728.1 hut operon positive regulator [Jeotgalicoccus pinnipedialis]CAD2072350.1 Hut operon positive regulatory protein [Jeotgalicoccus pinnipedialis]
MSKNLRFGKFASLVALTDEDTARSLMPEFKNFRVITGKVGTMDLKKVIASVETAAKREGLINGDFYRETHALYHAIVEAIQGVTRGDLAVGDIMRTVGLEFSIIRGEPYAEDSEGEWLAVCFYGTIGAPIRGKEHEALGLGINHI